MDLGIKDRVAIVSGASEGLGRAAALALAQEGARVTIGARREDALEAAAEDIRRQTGARVLAVPCDVSRPEDIRRIVRETLDRFGGRLDILVNNAGIYPFCGFLEMPIDLWDRVLNVNLRAVFLCTQMGGQAMAELGNGGAIINLASVQAFKPSNPGVSHYDTSKAAVVMLTKASALELAPHKIRVNAVAPGVIETPGTKPLMEAGTVNLTARVPLGRVGYTDDVANLILFLAGPAASFITGETVVVDGGYLLT